MSTDQVALTEIEALVETYEAKRWPIEIDEE